jgi:hypothetical protein
MPSGNTATYHQPFGSLLCIQGLSDIRRSRSALLCPSLGAFKPAIPSFCINALLPPIIVRVFVLILTDAVSGKPLVESR